MKGSETRKQGTWRGRLVATVLVLVYVLICAGAASGAEATAPKTPAATSAPTAGSKAPAVPAATPTPAPAPKTASVPPPPDIPETPVGTGDTIQATNSSDGTIELHAKNEDLANVLELLSQKYQLNIIVTRGAKGRVTVDLYKATIAQTLDAICRANNLKWSREDNSIYVFTPEEGLAIRQDEARLVTEVFPLNYLSGEDAVKFITPTLSGKATVAVNTPAEKGISSSGGGGGAGSSSSGGASTNGNSFGLQDSLVIRDYPENLAAAHEVLKRMDRKPRQVLIEATILQVKLDDDTSLGINFNTLAGIDFRDLTTASGFPVGNPGAVANATTTTAPISSGPWGAISTQGFATPGVGLNVGVITNNVAFFINALETVSDSTILSTPKVLALNQQLAEVFVCRRLGYRTTTTTDTTTIQTVNFLDTGTQLIFRPFISNDGYIRMEIHPKVSSGAVIDDLPQEDTTEITCNIMVKDGYTIVIGGLFDETTAISRSQVPGLGNVPGLGMLWRKKDDSTKRNEIIVLLTPHIIENDEASDALGRQFLDDAKRHCLGMRENFACFTRERITASYFQAADQAWQKYEENGRAEDLDCALWNVQLSLGVSPNHIKAMRLKDRILTEKKGGRYEVPNWTMWDTLTDRLNEMEEDKAAAAALAPEEPAVMPPSPPARPEMSATSQAPAAPATPIALTAGRLTTEAASVPSPVPAEVAKVAETSVTAAATAPSIESNWYFHGPLGEFQPDLTEKETAYEGL